MINQGGVPPPRTPLLSDRTGRIGTVIPNQHIGKEAAWGAKKKRKIERIEKKYLK